MRQKEILIAPLLEARIIDRRRMSRTNVAPDLVKTDHIFTKGIIRRQIGAAAEPALAPLGQKAKVGMHGGHEWAAGMQDNGDTGRREIQPLAWNLLGKLFRHPARYFRKINAPFFKYRALSEHARPATASAGTLPHIFPKIGVAVLLG